MVEHKLTCLLLNLHLKVVLFLMSTYIDKYCLIQHIFKATLFHYGNNGILVDVDKQHTNGNHDATYCYICRYGIFQAVISEGNR